ncbi:hypothetical protein MTR_8g088710 [Medicago truncatula]|uniref:Uncharacterized protein n=1 Tax=Medicago truncatula TaxID=3880 RepID=G7L8U3_MEDTR|nr:hypothetical protein MTR_8g088710 [Medicago truncatula]
MLNTRKHYKNLSLFSEQSQKEPDEAAVASYTVACCYSKGKPALACDPSGA